MLFIRYETSYDKWLPDSSREEIPEVVAATRLHGENMTLIVGDRQFLQGVDVVKLSIATRKGSLRPSAA